MTAKKSKRRYKCSDANMQDLSHQFESQYLSYKDRFEEFDGELFHQKFYEEFTNAINESRTIPSDNVYRNEVAMVTDTLTAKREECIEAVSDAKYFIKKAAKADRNVLHRCNYRDFDSCRASNNKMIIFMYDFNATIKKYRDELIAVSMPDYKISRLKELEQELYAQRQNQLDAKYHRLITTDYRIECLNKVWGFMHIMANAVYYAFPKGHIAHEIFSFPKPSGLKS